MHNPFTAFILVACFVVAQARAQDLSRGAICSYYPEDAVDKPSGLLKLQCAEGLQCCDTYIDKAKTQKLSICLESCPRYAAHRNSDKPHKPGEDDPADEPEGDDPTGKWSTRHRTDPKTGKKMPIADEEPMSADDGANSPGGGRRPKPKRYRVDPKTGKKTPIDDDDDN